LHNINALSHQEQIRFN